MGERTSGHFSDQLETRLPNGWLVNLSNERYRAADGNVYEVVGAPVDVEVALDPKALQDHRDTMLEQALAHLGG
jgi:C-terminal processing protease CtpA/Prc